MSSFKTLDLKPFRMSSCKKTGKDDPGLPGQKSGPSKTGTPACQLFTTAAIPRSNFTHLLSPRVRWHQVVRAIVDHKLPIVLAAVLDGERPDGGVVDQPIAEKLRSIVQSCVALLLNHLRSGGDGLLHELDDVGFSLESVTRRIVALAEVGPDV